MPNLSSREVETSGDKPDPAQDPPSGTPRWVKTLGVVALVVAIAVIALLLVGGGEHGPGRHSGEVPAASAPEGSPHTAPPGAHE